ncbi:MAG: hypothetical protein KAR42_17570 [candidate division Zixibacteria bacterium]|nr:hypothetical protein [candidate division Zixibacteria bacterium]
MPVLSQSEKKRMADRLLAFEEDIRIIESKKQKSLTPKQKKARALQRRAARRRLSDEKQENIALVRKWL